MSNLAYKICRAQDLRVNFLKYKESIQKVVVLFYNISYI